VGKTLDCLQVIKQKKKVIYTNNHEYGGNNELIQSLAASLSQKGLFEYRLSSMPVKTEEIW
jgi:hypothetical protein